MKRKRAVIFGAGGTGRRICNKNERWGVILVHDYFTEIFPNIEKVVGDYEKESGVRLKKVPAGDDVSIAVIK